MPIAQSVLCSIYKWGVCSKSCGCRNGDCSLDFSVVEIAEPPAFHHSSAWQLLHNQIYTYRNPQLSSSCYSSIPQLGLCNRRPFGWGGGGFRGVGQGRQAVSSEWCCPKITRLTAGRFVLLLFRCVANNVPPSTAGRRCFCKGRMLVH